MATIDFRKQNPLDVSLPTVSPTFGSETYKAQSRFAQVVQEGSAKFIEANAKLDAQKFSTESSDAFQLEATNMREQLLQNSKGGKMEDGRSAHQHYKEWSDKRIQELNKGAPNDLARRTVSEKLGSFSSSITANMIPKEIQKQKIYTHQQQENSTERAASEILNRDPDVALEDAESFIDLKTLDMEETVGNVFSPEEAAKYTKDFGNKIAISALDNFVNNDRPDLIIKSLGPSLNTKEGKAWLEKNGIDPESLPKVEGTNAIDLNVDPQQKDHYLKKAIQMMKAQDAQDNGILNRRINNFMTAQSEGKISESQSLDEFLDIEGQLLEKDRFGKDKYKPGFVAETLLKMTSAHVNRRLQQKINITPNGKLYQGANDIETSVDAHLNELKDRYKDNPEMLEHLNSPTIKDSMVKNARSSYMQAAKKAYEARMKDSSDYIAKNDEEAMKLTGEIVQQIAANGAPNPQTLLTYMDTMARKADELGIPKMAQSMLPPEVMESIATTAKEMKRTDKAGTGVNLSEFLETIKQGTDDKRWQDLKDELKDEYGLKEEDFYAVDNFDRQKAAYWQRLNNPATQEGIDKIIAGNKELSKSAIASKLTDKGFEGLGLVQGITGEKAWGEGILSTNSPLVQGLLGPGGEIRNTEIYGRMMDMATKAWQYEVGVNGKSVDEAEKIVEQKLKEAFPTIKGKHGVAIIPDLDEHGQKQVESFLNSDHKVTDFKHNFLKNPSIMAQMKSMDLVTQEQQNEYLNDNYDIKFTSVSQGRMGAYLVNKNDGTSIPFDVTGDDGKPQPLEFDLTDSKSLEEHTTRMRKKREAEWGDDLPPEVRSDNSRDPAGVPITIHGLKKGISKRLETLQTHLLDYQIDTVNERGKKIQPDDLNIESKKELLNLDKEGKNLAKVQDKLLSLPKKDPRRLTYELFINEGLNLSKSHRFQLKALVLDELQALKGTKGNIREELNLNFKLQPDDEGGFKIYAFTQSDKNRLPFITKGGSTERRYAYDGLMKKYNPDTGGYDEYTPERKHLLRTMLGAETDFGKHNYDSEDNKSTGPSQWAEAVMKDSGMRKHFIKHYPQYADKIDGIDLDVITHDDKLNIALMESFVEGSIVPYIKKHIPESVWNGYSQRKKDRIIYSVYNAGRAKDADTGAELTDSAKIAYVLNWRGNFNKDTDTSGKRKGHISKGVKNFDNFYDEGVDETREVSRDLSSLEINTPEGKVSEQRKVTQEMLDKVMEKINSQIFQSEKSPRMHRGGFDSHPKDTKPRILPGRAGDNPKEVLY